MNAVNYEETIVDRDIIIISQQPWDTEIGSNCKNIALELSKSNRVLYVNSPLDRISLLRNRNDPKVNRRINVIKGREDGLVKIQSNLWNYYPDCTVESINWINNHYVFNFLNKLNNRKFAKSIGKALKALNFTKFLLFNDNEIFKGFYLKDLLQPKLSIYYSRDYMIGVDYWKKHGRILEPELIRKSDLCFSNSEYLAEYCRTYNQNSFNIGQGCDVDDFIDAKNEKPDDLKLVNEPIIGYVGALNSIRLDIKIIYHIALSFPNFCILLVGPEDQEFRDSELHKLPNVLFLGQKPVDELPGYIKAFQVCINPQLINEITIGNYPRKIDEYLALGKPVVASHTKTMESFKDFVYLAKTPEDYVCLINEAFEKDNDVLRTERINFALTHTWKESVRNMSKEVNKII